jgi:hypothetical protein
VDEGGSIEGVPANTALVDVRPRWRKATSRSRLALRADSESGRIYPLVGRAVLPFCSVPVYHTYASKEYIR